MEQSQKHHTYPPLNFRYQIPHVFFLWAAIVSILRQKRASIKHTKTQTLVNLKFWLHNFGHDTQNHKLMCTPIFSNPWTETYQDLFHAHEALYRLVSTGIKRFLTLRFIIAFHAFREEERCRLSPIRRWTPPLTWLKRFSPALGWTMLKCSMTACILMLVGLEMPWSESLQNFFSRRC